MAEQLEENGLSVCHFIDSFNSHLLRTYYMSVTEIGTQIRQEEAWGDSPANI